MSSTGANRKQQSMHSFFSSAIRTKPEVSEPGAVPPVIAESADTSSESTENDSKTLSVETSSPPIAKVDTKPLTKLEEKVELAAAKRARAEAKLEASKKAKIEQSIPVAPITKPVSSSIFASKDSKPSKIAKPFFKVPAVDNNAGVRYKVLCDTLKQLEAESGRLKKIDILSNLFQHVLNECPDDLVLAVYLTVNKLGPAYAGIEIGVGEQLVCKAICESTGRSTKRVKASVEEVGDWGTVAMNSKSTQGTIRTPAPLTLRKVFSTFNKIAKTGTTLGKVSLINSLMAAGKDEEILYVIRAVLGQMRIGCNESTVLSALAKAIVLAPPEGAFEKKTRSADFDEVYQDTLAKLKKSFAEHPNWDTIVDNLLHKPISQLNELCRLTPGIPVKAMLAKPTKGISEILKRLNDVQFTLEFKYDGERAQIHLLEDGSLKIFSRNSEDHTGKFPELVPVIQEAIRESGVTSCIIDSEIVAWDREKKIILPFQKLSTRKRKDVTAENISVNVCIFAFDLLYINGKSLLEEPFFNRRALLHDNIAYKEGFLEFAINKDTTDPEEIQSFLETSMEGFCEGLMVKTLYEDATYEPDKRSHSWLKVKKDYVDSLTDTVDLVPVGAFYGKGKRTGVFGAFLLACYDPETEEYQSVCKIGTGFSDEALQTLATDLKTAIIPKPPIYYRCGDLKPDVWFDHKFVWEVKAADLSVSPVHQAAIGMVNASKGIALRFPRFLGVRTDKNVEDCTNAAQIAEMYFNQQQNNEEMETA